jgi:hypothetical protein
LISDRTLLENIGRHDYAKGRIFLPSVVSQKYFIKIGTTKEDRKSKLVIPRLARPGATFGEIASA